jgi:hypothetical protein
VGSYYLMGVEFKYYPGCQWLTPVTLATCEAEINREDHGLR